jgi:hypothetical protein
LVAGVTLDAAGVTLDAAVVTLDAAGVALDAARVTLDAAGVTLGTAGVALDAAGVALDATGVTLDAELLARSQYSEGPANRPPRHRFFLVSLCLQANAEMAPVFSKLPLHASHVALPV